MVRVYGNRRRQVLVARMVLIALVVLPVSQAFSPVASRASCLRKVSLQMCVHPPATAKKTLTSKFVSIFSALCLGTASVPSVHARDLSQDALLPLSSDGTSLVVTAAPTKEGRDLKSVGIAIGAGAAGFGSVFILRKGGKKNEPSPQEWAEQKQNEWKSSSPASSTSGGGASAKTATSPLQVFMCVLS